MFSFHEPRPKLRAAPKVVRGFTLRIDLRETKPPVWRRVVVPGSITLPELHDVVQAAMGWTDSHLHQFAVGTGHDAPRFVTDFDVAEGDTGLGEAGVRLDRVVWRVGDKLTYWYDFGDGWRHLIKVEKVEPQAPERPAVIGGRRACPPEDCGGTWGYRELAAWVESEYAADALPDGFDDVEHGRLWLDDWHPDRFDVADADEAVADLV